MPLCCWRSRPGCPPRLGGRRPRRRLFLPPPPEGCPGPTFIFFSFVVLSSVRPKGGSISMPLYDRPAGDASCRAPARSVRRNPVRLELTRECSVSVLAPGASGRGGPAREHGRWKHDHVTAHGGGNASPKSGSFAQK